MIAAEPSHQIPEFNLVSAPAKTALGQFYFAFYGLDIEKVRHYFGYLPSNGFRLSAHVFLPEKPLGAAFLVHGYDDHAGILRNLIRACLNERIAVATFDLPGHGLSTGPRSAIDDFGTYAKTLGDFVNYCAAHLPRPYFSMAHSTGCSVVLEYLYNKDQRACCFDRSIFLAPLVRSNYWALTRAAYFFASPVFGSVPRMFPKTSSDEHFMQFHDHDPLQSHSLPLSWVRALITWNRRLEKYGQLDHQVLIIQGDKDSVVDWRYNIALLREKIPSAVIKIIEGAGHQLANESEPIRLRVIDLIMKHLLSS